MAEEKTSGLGLILIGLLMLLYVIGGMMTGSLGIAVALGTITAWAAHMNVQAAIVLWTGVYIAVIFIVLSVGIYLEVS